MEKTAVPVREKEATRNELAVTAKQLAVTAKQLAVTAKEKEATRNELAVTAKKLAVTAKKKEATRNELAVTAKKLAVTAKKKEASRNELAVTAKEKENVRRKLAVTAKQLVAIAKEKEVIRRKLAVTAKQLAVTAKEKEVIRRKAEQLAVTVREKEDARNRLAVRAEELAITAEAMRNFISIASHDLRSPLASILGYSMTLSENWDTFGDEERRNTTAAIARQSQNLSNLVDDLLTLSSIEHGGLNSQPEMIVLREAIDQCLDAGDWDMTSVSVSCSPDLVVLVDKSHLGRILDNYIQNAFKYGEPPVQIKATRVGDMVQVRVCDHGPGVPPEFVSKLFSKFARANTSGTKANKGTGLGLSIVRALAEVNGGRTSYEPDTPSGGCFVVCLPTSDKTNS